jgi:hypothetical protein
MRVLIDGGKYTCSDYKISQSTNNTVTLNEYPYMGLLDKPFNPTFSIEYAQPDYYPYNPGVLTQNNLYVNYWRRTLAQINDGKLLKAYFWLTEEDIFKLRLNDKIKVNNALWYINKVVDYDANAHKPTLVELLSVEDDLRLPRFGRIIKPVQPGVTAPVSPAPVVPTGPIRPVVGVIADIIRKRTLATSVFSGYVDYESNQGVRNVLPRDFTGVVVGNDRTITEDGFYINDTKLTENSLNIKDEVILGEVGLAVGNTVLYTSNQIAIYDGFMSDGYVLDGYFTGSTGSIDFSGDTITLNGNVIIPTGYTLNGISIDTVISGITTPTLAQVLTEDNITGGNDIIITDGDKIDSELGYGYITFGDGVLPSEFSGTDNVDFRWSGDINIFSTAGNVNITAGNDLKFVGLASQTGDILTRNPATAEIGFRTTSEILGDINATPTSRTLTINGTTNQVTVSPTGAQDLTTNRSWTLSLPQNIHTLATPVFAGITVNGDSNLSDVNGLNVSQITTAGGVFTTMKTISLTTNNTTYQIECDIVTVRSTGGVGGSSKMIATFLRDSAGTVTQIGGTHKLENFGSTSLDTQFLLSGTNVLVQVKGVTLTTYDWGCQTKINKITYGV